MDDALLDFCPGINSFHRLWETGKPIDQIGFPTVRPPISNMPAKLLAFKEEVSK